MVKKMPANVPPRSSQMQGQAVLSPALVVEDVLLEKVVLVGWLGLVKVGWLLEKNVVIEVNRLLDVDWVNDFPLEVEDKKLEVLKELEEEAFAKMVNSGLILPESPSKATM
jgi:hypothetical protein